MKLPLILLMVYLNLSATSGIKLVKEFSKTLAKSSEKLKNSLVSVKAKDIRIIKRKKQEVNISMVGTVWNNKGYLVTGYLSKYASNIVIRLGTGKSLTPSVIGKDNQLGITVLKIETMPETLKPIKLTKTNKIEIGEPVISIIPTGELFLFEKFFQWDLISGKIPTQFGNKLLVSGIIRGYIGGRALANLNGELIAMQLDRYTYTHISSIKSRIEQIIKTNKDFEPGWSGIYTQPLTKLLADYLGVPYRGVIIKAIIPNSPADISSLKEDDIITEFNNHPINKLDVEGQIIFYQFLNASQAGDTVKIKIIRNKAEKEISLKLVKYPEAREITSKLLGITVKEITPLVAYTYNLNTTDGVIVIKVESGGSGYYAKINKYDVIIKVEEDVIRNIEDFEQAISKMESSNKNKLFIKVKRGESIEPISVDLKISKAEEEK